MDLGGRLKLLNLDFNILSLETTEAWVPGLPLAEDWRGLQASLLPLGQSLEFPDLLRVCCQVGLHFGFGQSP